MLINPETEDLIPLKVVCEMFPGRSGKGIALSTAWRWILHGQRGHKLESIVAGGQRLTSRQAVARFLAATNEELQPPDHNIGTRKSSVKLVEDELDALGL